MPVQIIATIYPNAGKEARIIELLGEMAMFVKDNEPNTLQYQLFSETDKKSGRVKFIMLESYTDMAAVKVHGASKEFKAFGKKMADEGLQEKPLTLQFIKSEGTGFDRAAKL